MFKKRKRPVAGILRDLDLLMSDAAETIFAFAADSGQEMPSREKVETVARDVVRDLLQDSIAAAIRKGISPEEAKAYADIIAARAQLTFQQRWQDLREELPICCSRRTSS